jgi:hypothetical protein
VRANQIEFATRSRWTSKNDYIADVRDRPFNLKGGGVCFFDSSEKKVRTTRELEYLFFLWRKVQFFFPEYNIRLYDKNSESYLFSFPPPK